jgi:RimJ/RimL family protein N-acetyltransferase
MVAKLAAKENFDQYFALRCEDINIYWTGHSSAPAKDKLYEWYLDNIAKEGRYFFLFFEENQNKVIGYLYMDLIHSNNVVDVGYGVSSFQTGKGYGAEINRFAIDFVKTNIKSFRHLQAWIARDNLASIKCVTKNGYKLFNEDKEVNFSNGEVKIFDKYILEIADN